MECCAFLARGIKDAGVPVHCERFGNVLLDRRHLFVESLRGYLGATNKPFSVKKVQSEGSVRLKQLSAGPLSSLSGFYVMNELNVYSVNSKVINELIACDYRESLRIALIPTYLCSSVNLNSKTLGWNVWQKINNPLPMPSTKI